MNYRLIDRNSIEIKYWSNPYDSIRDYAWMLQYDYQIRNLDDELQLAII